MKHLLFIAVFAALASFVAPLDSLTKKERKDAVAYLKSTQHDVLKGVKGLSEEQLNYKPSPVAWSVKECIFHIALSEENLRNWVDGVIQAPANPEMKKDIKVTDEQVKAGVSDRTTKRKTYDKLEPATAKWSNAEEALAAFKISRAKLIEYIKTTPDDLRAHIASETPMGPLDTYQMILLIASHSNRHLKQIDEVKASNGFPAQ